MKFHKKVSSFSFSNFSFNQTSHSNSNSNQNSPNRSQFEIQSSSNSNVTKQDDPLKEEQGQQQEQEHQSNTSVTLLLSPKDPLQFIISPTSLPPRKRAGSLIEQSSISSSSDQRRSSFAEAINHLVLPDRGRRLSNPICINSNQPSSPAPTGSNHFNRHKKRLSNLLGPLTHQIAQSRSPSPHRLVNHQIPSELPETGHQNQIDSNSILPQNDLPSSESEDDSDSNSNLSQSDRSDQLDYSSDSEQDQTILANTFANASSITPIDFLQTSNQPIPFMDQAPNLTSPPPLPISFAHADPARFSSATTTTVTAFSTSSTPTATATTTSVPILSASRKPSLNNRSSIRRRASAIRNRQDLKLTVSRPIYQKNRCTITIEHGNWLQAVEKAERTRFYLVACDLSDESKYAIEWTIGTVLRQGDECLIIMIIETDCKFDPEDGLGSAADRTAKIRNQKDRQEKATLLVREATSLLERTGLHAKVTCQAVHGKNPKHMLVDCIDFLEPNLVIVGRRGITSSKGSLMGSVSDYLVQKSSVPVMVARRRLRTLPKVYKKKHGLTPNSTKNKLTGASIEKNPRKSYDDRMLPTPVEDTNENKRLSVVSEEIDLKLQLALVESESPQQQLDSPQTDEEIVAESADAKASEDHPEKETLEMKNQSPENMNSVDHINQLLSETCLDKQDN